MARKSDANTSSSNDVDVLTMMSNANNEAVGYVNRVDTATSKFRKSQRRGSIIKAAQGNVFEFPVFISNTIPLDYATATVSLLEQVYATYLQMAISQNPVISADTAKRGVQFADYKTNTNRYLECVDTFYQQDACHAEYVNEDCKVEFDMLSIEDKEAKLINEAVDYQPLSEFDHFFQEAPVDESSLINKLYPVPIIDPTTNEIIKDTDSKNKGYNVIDPRNIQYKTGPEIYQMLQSYGTLQPADIATAMDNLDNTIKFYGLKSITPYDVSSAKPIAPVADAQMKNIQDICSMLTKDEFAQLPDHAVIQDQINKLNAEYPGFGNRMNQLMNLVEQTRTAAEEREAERKADRTAAEERLATQAGYEANKDRLAQQQIATSKAQKAAFQQQIATSKAQKDQAIAGARQANANANKLEIDTSNIPDTPSYQSAVAAGRRKAIADATIAVRNAQKATSPYYRAADAAHAAGQAVGAWTGAINQAASAVNQATNAYTNIKSMPDTLKSKKADAESRAWDAAHKDEVNARQWTDTYARSKTSNIQYVRDADCQKLNTMKPLLMRVTLNMLNKNDSLQPIEYIIGVKCHTRLVPSSVLPEVAEYPLKEMDKISRKVKWRAGELKFIKDLVFHISEKKQTAADSRDPSRKWYRRLYELAHMKGDAPAAAVVEGKSLFKTFIKDKQGKGGLLHGMIPNASIIMAQTDVDNIKSETGIDLLKASTAKKFCGELFLMSLIIIDTDRESIKILLPDMNSDYDVHSLAAVNRQIATLDTVGTKTRDIFKALGA